MVVYVLLAAGLALLWIVAVIFWTRRLAERRREALQRAAQLLGLHYLEGEAAYEQAKREQGEEGLPPLPLPKGLERLARKLSGPRLAGWFRGVRVAVFEQTRSSGSGSHTESVHKAYFSRPLPFELDIRKEGVGARVAKAFGGQDVTIGDPPFDTAVRIRTSSPEAAALFLQAAERRKAVLAALQACPSTSLCRTHVHVCRQGRLKDGESIRQVLSAIAPVAAAFSE